jgi:cyclopropane fatty-acyl-phospholipid synthase-like methyltransferase
MTPELPYSPAAERNKDAILGVLRALLPAHASVLEIASGTGQHAAHMAAAQTHWTWQPTDVDDDKLDGIEQRCAALPNVRPPHRLDVVAEPWVLPPGARAFDAVFSANMLHASPWATCGGLMRGAAGCLAASGQLVVYGPFILDDAPTAPSNLAFDADLRARDASWGLRRLTDVSAAAASAGLALRQRIEMPANNLVLVFGRA